MAKLLLIVSIFTCTTVFSSEGEGVTLYTYDIVATDSASADDSYAHFIRSFSKRANITDNRTLPFRRALSYFQRDKKSCIFPVQKESLRGLVGDFVYSEPFIEVDLNVITFRDAAINNLEQLKGKEGVSLTQIRLPASRRTSNFNYFSVEKLEQAISMLSRKRVDYIIAPGLDTVQAENRDLVFNKKLIVFQLSDILVCHNNLIGRSNIRIFDKLVE
jgi:hypothetical protein